MIKRYMCNFKATGAIVFDVPAFLMNFNCQTTAEHCTPVACKAKELATKFGCDPIKAENAAYLHDISAVVPVAKRVEFAEDQGIEILPEERRFPMIIHQKLSVVFAKKIFNVTDKQMLSAIGCHTTLKAEPSLLDKIVFIADKIKWDQEGIPPYLDKVERAMNHSLDSAVLAYLHHLWDSRHQLKIIHPWLVEALDFLKQHKNT